MILVYFGRVMFLGGKQPGLSSTRGWGRFQFQDIPASGAFVLPVKVAANLGTESSVLSGDLRYDPTVFNAGVTVVLACIAYVLSKGPEKYRT